MVSNSTNANINDDQPIPFAVRAEILFLAVLFLLALISVPLMRSTSEKNAVEDQRIEQQRAAKAERMKEIRNQHRRKPEKTEEQKLADTCGYLALERVRNKVGGKDPLDFYIWRESIHFQYDGFDDLVANFDVGTLPIVNPLERVNETASKRKELYRRYIQANQAISVATGQSSTKDEFETTEEFNSRIKNKELVALDLEKKRNKIVDDIVVLEKTCNPELLRSSITGVYALNEALIFVPVTDWCYEAEQGRFNVKGRIIKDPDGTYWHENDEVTFQAFHFQLKGIRASQFVKSSMITCQYEIGDEGWDHPRNFKEYKQQHPFLLVHLGRCDLKVQGTSDRIMTMPLCHISQKEKESQDRIVTAQVEDGPFSRSVVRDQSESICREVENEAQKVSKSIFNVHTCERYHAGADLPIVESFADYKTAKGRAEIENILKHFESIGGVYYKEFCKAVRSEMSK